MTTRNQLALLLALLVVGVAGSALYANASVNRRADEALAEYSRANSAPDASKLMMVQASPDDKFVRLVDRSSGKFVKEPLTFKALDGGIYAVKDDAVVRLSGNLVQNYGIWIFGTSKLAP